MRFLRHSVIAATAVLSLVAATACDSGGSSAAGGEIAVAGQFPIESIDPNGPLAIDGGTRVASIQLYSPLLDTVGPGKFDGRVAEKWETDGTATKTTFTLRPGITFSDGTPITGQDVVKSFERTVAADSPFSANFKNVKAQATGTVVTFTSANPDPALPAKLTGLMITPAAATEQSYLDKPVTSGPFQVESFTPGGDLVMVPNAKYWGDKPTIERVTIRSVPEVAARVTALETGELDIIWGISDDQVKQLKSNSEIEIASAAGSGVLTMWMNSSTPSLQKAEVRKALWQAVDFDKKIKALYPDSGEPANSVIAPTVFGYAPQEPVKYDPDAAKKALVAAGFDFNTTLRFHFSQAQFRQWVTSVVSDLAAIGVKAQALEKEQAVYTKDLLALKWDINIQQVGTLGLDASYNLGRLYTCAAKRTGYCDPKLDELLKKAGSAVDPEDRKTAYAEATKLIWDQAVGMYPMFVKNLFANRSSVGGFQPDGEGLPRFQSVTLDG
ncbi:peptide/nickel transport system substrate-binding protein [Kribbella amoyensis]|uniref:Peptide/nickel transport system substrate-binding protein n=1 Tax=Kribbella amoyensis TaxID=996641 RepID=A0A561BT06_9ACTN|nr:ABC transporter substrate-binding protein [Kribbella amoyensis]TWD81959.1 peptide/nickel transport system substrate-binding protein [Kribbella amoyensis]